MAEAIQRVFLLAISVFMIAACTVDRELDGREGAGPMSRISDWWYGDEESK